MMGLLLTIIQKSVDLKLSKVSEFLRYWKLKRFHYLKYAFIR